MPGPRCAGSGAPADRLAIGAVHLLPQVAMLAGAMAVACGAVLALRRLAGAIGTPPGPAAALAVCGAGLLLVSIADLAVRSSVVRSAGPAMSWLPAVLTRLGLVMAVTAVSLPLRFEASADAITTMLALLLSLVVACGGPATATFLTRSHRRPAPAAAIPHRQSATQSAAVMPPSATLPTAASRAASDCSEPHDRLAHGDSAAAPVGTLLQRFERRALPAGAEYVRGRVSVVVPEGTRTGYAHVGFCPPLAASPTVEVTTDYDGVEALVSAAEVLPWGVRIECRLDEPAEETIEIPVDILATTPT